MLTPKWSPVFPLVLGAAVSLGLATGAHAQFSQNSQGTPKNQPQTTTPNNNDQNGQNGPQNRGFWSDPAFQLNRLRQQVSNLPGGPPGRGGRGGSGGGNNNGGNNNGDGLAAMIELLDRSPALQEELKLKPEQKEKLAKIEEQTRQQQRELFQSLRNRGNNNGGGNNNAGRGGRGGFDPVMMQQMMQARSAVSQQSEAAIMKVLTKSQVSRLKQIRLQIVGPIAVAEPAVAEALMLTDEQYQEVQQIVRLMGDRRRQMMESRMQEMRAGGGPGGPNGAPPQGAANRTASQRSPGQAQTKESTKAQVADADENADDGNQGNANRQGRRGFDPNSPEAAAMQERMKESMSEDEKVRKEAESAIGKILASAQRARFNKMLGPIIDLNKLVENTTPGGGRGGPGGNRGGRGGPGGATN